MSGPLCNTEDFGTACVKLVPNFRRFCIVKFKIGILILSQQTSHALSMHYQKDRREARKVTTLIGLRNVRELMKTVMGEESLFQ